MKEGYRFLGEYIRQVDIRNKEGKKENLLGVSVQKQFIQSIANTVGTDFTKYKVVKKGQFTYIPDTSRRGDKIAIALLEDYEEGLTDFWRVGKGYAKKLEEHGLFTMGDIARCSIGKSNELYNEELLYKLFGINAELLIDHAWGYEPCTMEQVKAYKPETNSVCSGQVLHCPYDYEKAKLIVKEMTDQMVLDLVDKGLVTDQLVLTIGYDIENLSNPNLKYQYKGEVTIDRYGRKVPKHAHGTANLEKKTSSTRLITNAVMDLYDRIVDEHLLVRRITITANKLVDEKSVKQEDEYQQLDLFTDYEAQRKKQAEEEEKLERERRMQEAMLSIKKKFGKNAVLKGMNLEEGATAKDRNEQIGGHKA